MSGALLRLLHTYSQLLHLTQMPMTLGETNKGSSNLSSHQTLKLCLCSLTRVEVIIELVYPHDHMLLVPFHALRVKG
jgi:hypothetical protein